MRRHVLLSVCVLCALSSCNKPKPESRQAEQRGSPTVAATAAAVQPARPVPDACTLLTSDEIKAVLGEPVQETKPSSNAVAGDPMATSQCYFALPTAANSAVLTVIRKGAGNATRVWWQETFHREHDEEKGEREEGEKKSKPEKVDGIGEEAFWTASKIGGVLYVLQTDTCVRISVGGKDDLATKLKKSQALAEIVLKRL